MASLKPKNGPKSTGLKRIIFLPDVHVPFQDVKACELVFRVAKDFKPDILVQSGDLMDCYAISQHSKDPNRLRNFESEVDATNAFLDRLDKLAPRRIFTEGNHENRLPRYLQDRAPELYNMIQIPKLLRLKERGWEYVPYKRWTKVGKLQLTHETGKCGANAHAQAGADFGSNVVIGHTHRMAVTYTGNVNHGTCVSAMFGHLTDTNKVDYMHVIKAETTWQTGFGIGYLDSSTGCVHLQAIPIIKNRCVVEGKLYK